MSSPFKNSLLVIVFNYAACLDNRDFFRSLYAPHFKKIFVYSDLSPDGTRFDDVTYVSISRGWYTQRVFVHFHDTFQEEIAHSDGVFYTMDDNILNTNLFHTADTSKVIISSTAQPPLSLRAHCGWHWDNTSWGKRAIERMQRDRAFRSRFAGLLYTGGFSDFFYVPRALFNEKFVALLRLFSAYSVFLELAIPTALCFIANESARQTVSETVLWNEERAKLREKAFFDQVLRSSFIVHPIKLNESPVFAQWLTDALVKKTEPLI